jgi:hypothetical protein
MAAAVPSGTLVRTIRARLSGARETVAGEVVGRVEIVERVGRRNRAPLPLWDEVDRCSREQSA